MPSQHTLRVELQHTKMQNLRRRMAAVGELPQQVAAWRQQANAGQPLALHQSQVEALARFLDKLQALLQQAWADLEGAQEAEFPARADRVQRLMIHVYRAWRFYRERFDQRASTAPVYTRFLTVADEVAWSAYRVCMDQAHDLDILTDRQRFKQPPLLHLFEQPSPIIYARAHQALIPNMPVHVIDLPYYETSAAWSLLALHHEVAHGLLADLAVDPGSIVLTQADGAGLAMERRGRWMWWAEEIVADCFALLLAGPPFARELMDVLVGLGPGDPEKGRSPHPPPYLRIPLACTFLATMEEKGAGPARDQALDQRYRELAARHEEAWSALHSEADAAAFQPYLDERDRVLALLMDTKLPTLDDHSLRELGSFTPGDFRLASGVAEDYLVWGQTPGQEIPPRLVIPAARMAFDRLNAEDDGLGALPARLERLHEITLQAVEANPAEGGTRALYPGEEDFLDGLAEALGRTEPAIELLEEVVWSRNVTG